MKRRASPTRIGLFVLGALALLVAAVVMVSGSGLFAERERALAYFDGSVYGLQIGAPVVLRGVRLGSVVGIGVVYQGRGGAGPGRLAVPVELEIDRSRIGQASGRSAALTLAELVQQGLSARLSLQSLLTGLLYVDLDFAPTALGPGPKSLSSIQTQTQAGPAALAASATGLTLIPTLPSPLQALQQLLQQLDVGQLLTDLSGAAAGARQLLGSPRLQQTVDELALASTELRRLLARVERRVDPLADGVQGTLQASRQAATAVTAAVAEAGEAVARVSSAADRVSASMQRLDRLADGAQPMLDSVQRAADELTRTAQALRQLGTADDGALPQVEQAAHELARAARAVRDLADLLERQPEALLRGRAAGP